MNEFQLPDFGIDWNHLWMEVQTLGLDFAINLIAAIAIFFIGRAIVHLVDRGLRKVMTARAIDPILEAFIATVVYWALMAFVIIAAIQQIGLQTASLIALIGAAGIAVGLALQGSLANFAAGVLIVIFRPYRVGDWIEAAGTAGTVVSVQLLTTELASGDNRRIIVPNGQVMDSIITNYSALPTRRIDLVFRIGYEEDIERARGAIRELVEADERVLEEPPCQIVVGELSEYSIHLYVRPWVDNSDYWSVYFDLTESVKKRFDALGISVPLRTDLRVLGEAAARRT
ncbi:MAG TPA: mechanosensitive ion channel domain-containing protein [Woeseiaceae bacterium]|nr:mechanosensitive ion channel domain-containing protein [Woeseiaceae bacterium]